MDLAVADDIVQEYCIYRGFVESFRSIDSERAQDKTKSFEAHMIVHQIFDYLHNGGIEHFISLWDFLNKRFFTHLDQEHCQLFAQMKADLVKYYLVACIKAKNKVKVTDFFTNFSKELLCADPSNDLRKWYVLPYLENPAQDNDFMAFFTLKWLENLKTTLFNYITLVLRSAPPPRLLLVERWFRSETQVELRQSIELSACKLEACTEIIDALSCRISALHKVLGGLVKYIVKFESSSSSSSSSSSLFNPSEQSALLSYISECADKTRSLSELKKETRLNEIARKHSCLLATDSSLAVSSSLEESLEEFESKLLSLLGNKLAPVVSMKKGMLMDGWDCYVDPTDVS